MAEWRVEHGDCREVMAALPPDSVDSIVTDPPYGLGFMGAKWDKFGKARFKEFMGEVAKAAWHALKPGGFILAFGGTRTYHWLVDPWEDAGFEVRDQLLWLYGTGFPKSSNIAKQIDKAAGVEPLGSRPATLGMASNPDWNELKTQLVMPDPTTPAAIKWAGWGTALKPAVEPVVVLRKPFKQAVYKNVLEHGTGALNIDGCRVGGDRWPSNVLLDEEAAELLGDARRFFYCAKPSRQEKEAGLDHFTAKDATELTGRAEGSAGLVMQHADGTAKANPYAGTSGAVPRKNTHPTVKPIALLRYLARLVTPPGGTLLDPFCGSGSAGIAAGLEGFDYIGVELDSENKGFVKIARARILHHVGASARDDHWLEGF